MYPSSFEYERAESVEDALSLMDQYADENAELLAGGHSLLPTMKSGLASPDVLIDIGHIDELHGIEENGDSINLGALTSYSAVDDAETMWNGATAFAEAAHRIGDVQVRNRGTVGGNIAHADPASDLPAALLASDGTVVAHGPDGERSIPVDDFFETMYTTALAEDEILTRLELPKRGQNSHVGAYAKKPSPSSGYAMVGVAVVLELDGESVNSARIAANGAMDHAVRLEPVEEALTGETLSDDTIAEAAEHATDDLDTMLLMDDLQASSEFRAQLLKVYTKRALESGLDRVNAPAPAAD